MTFTNHGPLWLALACGGFLFLLPMASAFASGNLLQDEATKRSLTPLQLEIELQRRRLNAAEVEERRDAVMRLAALRHPEASRTALVALKDALPIVRATAPAAVLSLPEEESTPALIPLLSDKDEFVRQEAAYALGKTRSKSAVAPLIERLNLDKKDGVRGAAAIALGQIGDEAAVVSLAQVLSPQLDAPNSSKARKNKKRENVFVLRAAARSLGQIASRAGVPALLAIIEDEQAEDDVRREAAEALGLIGDPSALPALQKLLTAQDPSLSLTASKAVLKISNRQLGRSS